MNFIYDILLDFNDIMYDFFDWNEKDKITHIRKIPLLKVSADICSKFKNNKVKIDENILENIKDKTETFQNHRVQNIEYACLISDGLDVFAILFDKNGVSNKYSNLLLDENDEVIEVCERIEQTDISISVIDKRNNYNYLTRKDISIIEYVQSEIENLKNEKDIDKIKYLYYELFDEKCDNLELILDKMRKNILNTKSKFYLKIYNFFKLTSLKK